MRAAWLWAVLLLPVPVLRAQGPPTEFTEQKCLDLLKQTGPSLERADAEAENTRRQGEALEKEKGSCGLGSGTECASPAHGMEMALLAGTEDSRAFLRYGSGLEGTSDPTSWSLEATVPFDKDDEEGVFATASGVSGDITLEASAGHTSWRSLDWDAYYQAVCRTCMDKGAKTLGQCDQIRQGLTDAEKLAITDAPFPRLVGTRWGGSLSVGREERKYFDDDAEAEEEDRIGYGAAVNGDFFLKRGRLALELAAKRDYEEADDATHCTAIDDSELEECETLPRSRAEAEDSVSASVEWKVPFKRLALAPRLERSFSDSSWNVQLPIYLVRDADKQWSGGVRLAWDSDPDDDADEFGAALFVSMPLDF